MIPASVSERDDEAPLVKYKLKATSSVNTALRSLINKEMVYKTQSGYIVYDRFFAIWLRQQPY